MPGATNDKRLALRDYLRDALEAVETGVQAYAAYRRASETDRGTAAQEEALGSPVYYLEVMPTGITAFDEAPSGAYRRREHQMEVVFLYEYDDDPDDTQHSQHDFSQRLDAVVDALADGHLLMDPPQEMEPQTGDMSHSVLDTSLPLIAHELTIPVLLKDQNA